MADILNLRRARKAKAKQAKDAAAEANRLQFGRTKSEKNLSKARKEQTERSLDGHKIEHPKTES